MKCLLHQLDADCSKQRKINKRNEGTRHSFATQTIQSNGVTMVKEQKYLHTKMDRLSEAVNTRGVIKLQNRTDIEPIKGDKINSTITNSYK